MLARVLRTLVCVVVAGVLPAGAQVKSLSVRVLSTMLTDTAGIGEWGFAAVVEADGRRILFDTGARPETVLANAREMKVDLCSISDIVVSHNHGDHTGGLVTLRRECAKINNTGLSRSHLGEGAFYSRRSPDGAERNYLKSIRAEYEKLGGTFIEYNQGKELFPGVWFTGPVKRTHPERNWSGQLRLTRPDGASAEDNVPEDSSLVINTPEGLVVISGCGHAGIINTLEQARVQVRRAPIVAAIGGWHLFQASDEHLEWTAARLKEMGLRNFLGAHCTGVEATYKLRQLTGLNRRTCAVGAVGGGYSLAKGLEPGLISR